MKLNLTQKLYLAFLGLTLFILIATLGLARWSFEYGFLDYVNALEQNRLDILADDIAISYIESGHSWDQITEEMFVRILDANTPSDSFPPLPPPSSRTTPPGRTGDFQRPPPSSNKKRFRPPGKARLAGPPTALFDTNSSLIAGIPLEPDVEAISVQIEVRGTVVGSIRSAPRRHFSSVQETAFSKQQLYTSAMIGVISLVMALIVSYILTRLLLRPIKRMINGVSVLSSGDYSHRLNESRNDELGQLMQDLDNLATQLEENRSSRKRWLADISHELRTPLTILTGEIETMKDGIRPIDLNQVLSLDQEVIRLRRLVDDLYELSVSDLGGLRYSYCSTDIQHLITEQIKSQQTIAADKGILVVLKEAVALKPVRADPARLHQLFANLISNSLHYTDSPGTLELQLSQDENRMTVVMSDTPPGVSQAEYERLFDPLYRQESSRSRRTAGAGLGLAICSNIVKAHQGTISATSSEIGGLKITMTFPLYTGG